MTQGIRIKGYEYAKSKKAVKEAVAAGEPVYLVATSFFGNEYDGPISDAPDGFYTFVGPDEQRRRNFFGNIIKQNGKVTVK